MSKFTYSRIKRWWHDLTFRNIDAYGEQLPWGMYEASELYDYGDTSVWGPWPIVYQENWQGRLAWLWHRVPRSKAQWRFYYGALRWILKGRPEI